MPAFAERRERMVERQIAGRGVDDPLVLEAMRKVPREAFVSKLLREFAYEDSALPIEESQTISQPYIVATMIEAAELTPGDRVLEIGAGSGYAAAVMAQIAGEVFAIERHERLARLARERLARLGYGNIEVKSGDGTLGWPQAAPFDAIIASAGGPHVPQPLLEQLAEGGRLVIPVGESPRDQRLLKLTRVDGAFREKDLGPVAFVPLIGEEGWSADGRRPAPREPRSWA
jgi:protein-L-isoaspartate(D-aspartate) O-methyltransferase